MDTLDQIKSNHVTFNFHNDMFVKLGIAAKNATIQMKAAIIAMEKTRELAKACNFNISEDGELIKIT